MTLIAADHLPKDVYLGEEFPNPLGSVLKLIELVSEFGGLNWQEWDAWKVFAPPSKTTKEGVTSASMSTSLKHTLPWALAALLNYVVWMFRGARSYCCSLTQDSCALPD